MECVHKRQKNNRETHREWEFEVQIPFSASMGLKYQSDPIVTWKGKIYKKYRTVLYKA